MTIQEFVQQLPSVSLRNDKITTIENIYSQNFPDIIKQIISCAGDGGFFDDENFCRQLSFDDIIHAQKDLNVNFVAYEIIPLFDKMDNDYVVFNFKKGEWAMFNIVDESFFMDGMGLEKLLS